jgi:uncharacterized protein YndB with AHSA1/START domain
VRCVERGRGEIRDTGGETSFETAGDHELEIIRTFDAPRQTVFDAFTVCESATRWMGPPGWEVTGCEIDPRPGGVYRFVWKSPQGYEVEKVEHVTRSRRWTGWSRPRTRAPAERVIRSS